MKRPGEDRPAIYVLTALLVVGVFGLDLVTHLGTEEWVLYFIPLTVSLFASRPIAPIVIGVACAGLVGAGYVLSAIPESQAVVELTRINRALGSAALIGIGFVGWRFVATRTRLELEDWINDGQVQLSAKMRGERDLDELGGHILSVLAEYTGARVGSIYIAEDGGVFARKAGYGLGVRLDDATRTVALGQTLVGQVAANGRILVADDVPAGYIDIRSGIGAAKPRTLILAPTDADGVANGVIELGYFTPPPPAATHALLRSVSASVGIAIRSARYRRLQAELLEETQRQAEELQNQHEELKAANEELEHQGRALHESHTELEERNRQLVEQAHVLQLQKEHLSSAQDILQRQAAEVERASQYKSDFLANMSHELRTPLNSSLILAKLLVDNKGGNLTPEQVQFATIIYTAGNDLLTLINDILDLSKIEAGKLELTFEQVDLARLFATAMQRFGPLAKEKKIDFACTIEPSCPPRLETDGMRLQQIIANLLSNAVKFTERGSVSLRGAAGGGDQVLISVEDTGIGIPAHLHGTIFEAFRQADRATHRKHGGTGLGLSICRELVNLLGGEIALTSAPGEGSTFTVVLPGRPGKVHRARGARPETGSDQGALVSAAALAADDDRVALTDRRRVLLVVEDDRVLATALRELAHEFRFDCVVARSAAEGLELVRTFAPIAIILDLSLPDHSGLTVLDFIKRDASARHTPIYVVAAHDHEQVARDLGIVGYSLKPLKREELVAAFRRLEDELARKTRAVLVVEDDAIQREAIVKLLASDGVAITAVRTAEEASAQLDAQALDCVVLDVMLPGMSGLELLDRMTRSGNPRLPPVIVYTARALTLDEEQRLRRHAKSIIIKGARSPERLLEEVTLFLHQAAADLPDDKRRMLRRALDRDEVFAERRILIVEDDVRSIFALTSALEPRGAVIEVARNGREALRRIDGEPRIDIVLMDVMMPEMDGLTATREIRRQHALSSLPIIALTAKAMPDDRQRCFDAGANDYVAKPVDVDKLISLCRVWMPR